MKRIIQTLEEVAELLRQQNLQQKEILSLSEASEFLGFKQSYMYKMSADGELPCYAPTGRKLIFRRSELQEWAFRNRRATKQELNQKALDFVTKKPIL